MQVLGFITEYNPFHNGHLYHLNKSKKECNADAVVCVMSGNFVQRGEPAIVNKWARAKMAIEAGIDLVLELPLSFAMSSAEHFAYGAVKVLESIGIVDFLSFGSESGNLRQLEMIADILLEEPIQFKSYLKNYLATGISFPLAREKALEQYLSSIGCNNDNLSNCLSHSNNILGIEYLKALKRIYSKMKPFTINRIGCAYNSCILEDSIPSASAIRKAILNERTDPEGMSAYLPETSVKVLNEEFASGRGPVDPESFGGILLAKLRGMSAKDVSAYPDVSEGLENRIIEAAYASGTLGGLVNVISTKRYPVTRIQRILMSIMLGMTREIQDSFDANGGPQYIRVLAFNEKGRQLLSDAKDKATMPVVVKTADYKNPGNRLLKEMIMFEAHATDIYVLGYSNHLFRKGGQEFTVNIF